METQNLVKCFYPLAVHQPPISFVQVFADFFVSVLIFPRSLPVQSNIEVDLRIFIGGNFFHKVQQTILAEWYNRVIKLPFFRPVFVTVVAIIIFIDAAVAIVAVTAVAIVVIAVVVVAIVIINVIR
ncbi:hypothetical protein BX666DRAFT_1879360 [Dichotomocladium elegans]|nr:hypothetical protein BX666DRAFT_1879360 [Dichotomocladium elegans]